MSLAHGWKRAARTTPPFGEPTEDGRARFDLAPEHTAEVPALRRVNNPSEIDGTYMEVMRDSAMTDMVAALIGPDVKHHHCKINLKLPGTHTEVRYHQDFAYTPHTNDDVVTALLMLDDMTPENGCLMVVPGSHRGPMYSLFDGERFTGFIAPGEERALREREEPHPGSRRQRVPDAHPARPRFGAQSVRGAARALHLRLQRRRCLPHRTQSHAQPERGCGGARPGHAPGAARGGGHRASGAAGAGLVLHGAGGGERRGGLSTSLTLRRPSAGRRAATHRDTGSEVYS